MISALWTRDPCLLSLESLPRELLQLIVAHLATSSLKNVALVSKTLHRHAIDRLWRNVCLVDQCKLHPNDDTPRLWGDNNGRGESDEHDDTPIVRKLYILATNPFIASKVQALTHRCHLPTPNIFTELPRMHFHTPNLSQDDRLHCLLRLAIRNMVNVHTLRIVYGHMSLTNLLVAGFLDQNRRRRVPLRKLWLESCCLSISSIHFLSPSNVTGLQSIRIRRLNIVSLETLRRQKMGFFEFTVCRGGQHSRLHNGAGNWIGTTIHFSEEGLPELWPRQTTMELLSKAHAYDILMWSELPIIKDYIDANRHLVIESGAPSTPIDPMRWLLKCSASTLTSLNLDWILWRRRELDPYDDSLAILNMLTALRFPHLRAFQVRNAVLSLTKLPDDIFLFENSFLEFMEAHPKIQTLGWPIDRFYSHVRTLVGAQTRVQRLVAHLSTMVTNLRIDTHYSGHGEPLTDISQTVEEAHERIRRRRFIAEFVPHMRKVEQIKLEGGLPRDEKREILRALHWCPLKKIVMIGVSFPVGNTWGAQGVQLKVLDPGQGPETVYNLGDEDLPGILQSYRRGLPMLSDFEFEPNYGWPPQAPLLQTIALHHASTVEELKICGYNGCPILSYQTPMTDPLLKSLRHFDNLKQLVLSFWLLTWYEDSYRDTEIIQSWLDTRSPSSTALVVVTPPQSPSQEFPVDPGQFPNADSSRVLPRQDFNRWAVTLKTQFSPSAIAYRVARDIAPYLSPVAKNNPCGIRVRASFCLGIREGTMAANDIFDLDIRIGKDDQVLEFIGPREEGEPGRWWQKLESRQWF